jgi:hypothetical protein
MKSEESFFMMRYDDVYLPKRITSQIRLPSIFIDHALSQATKQLKYGHDIGILLKKLCKVGF